MDANKKWMSKGHVGCTFAALFAKAPEKVGWYTIEDGRNIKFTIPKNGTSNSQYSFLNGHKNRLLNGLFQMDFMLKKLPPAVTVYVITLAKMLHGFNTLVLTAMWPQDRRRWLN